NYAFSQDESKLLLLTEPKPVYRHSTYYTVYVFDLASQNITLVDESPILHAQFNPQANQVAFVKENNLFIKNLTNQTLKQVTHDGKWNHIINGNCDWVYEEEFSFTQAYQWSPSGQ